MKIILTKFDVLEILIDHFGISHYHVAAGSGKPQIELDSSEIYWEGNPEKVENETK